MNPELITLLACPICREELADAEKSLQCAKCGSQFPIRQGVPIFLREAGEVITVSTEHASNALGAEFEQILARGDERILHLGAGSSATRYLGCIELEHKIFRHTDVVGDAHVLPFRDLVFDRVFAFNVFEQLRDPARAAREILRVLKPGGALALQIDFTDDPNATIEAAEKCLRKLKLIAPNDNLVVISDARAGNAMVDCVQLRQVRREGLSRRGR